MFAGRARVGLGRKMYVGLRETIRRNGTEREDRGARPTIVTAGAREDRPASADDLVVVVDSDDREVGQAGKLDVHVPPGIRHRAFSVLVRGDDGWLLQQRAPSKYHFAGLWSNTCCSHPRPGEDIETAARRRLMEELGMQASELETVGRFEYVAADPVSGFVEHEVVHVLVADAATEPRPAAEEVAGVRWIGTAELLDEIAQHPSSFTPWLPDVLSLAVGSGRPAGVDGAR